MQISYSFPWWLALLFLIPSIGIIAFFYFRTDKPLRGHTRFILIALRSIAIGLILFCLLEPMIIAHQETQRKGNLLILVDNSQSMNIKDQEGNSRIESIRKILANDETSSIKNNISELSKHFNVRLYQFSSSATAVEKLSLNADGSQTDIGNSLTKAIREWRGQPIAGIMLITDGANNSGADPVIIAQQSGIPVYTVGVGSKTSSKDIQISMVSANPIAYTDHILPIKVSIKSQGYDGKEIRVSLVQENVLKDTISLRLNSKEGEQVVNLQFKPQQEGTLKMRVSIPAEPDEYNKQNNSFPFLVRVIKTKLKVLYIEGRPRWEYTFLKRALQRDPNLETTFMIANKQNTFYPISDRNSFPEKLTLYDVIILGDISPSFFKNEQLNAIKAYIENTGGSLLLLAGEDSLGKGGFTESSLKELLPIEEPKLIKGTFNPILTQYGQIHPVTRLSDDQTENNAIIRDLPAIYQFYASAKIKSGSIVLLESQQESGKPLIVFQRYGKGIVMLVTTDNTWQWAFAGYPFGIDDSHYRKLWSGAIRWLASAKNQADKINVETDKQSYYKYEKVRIVAYIYNENYEPIDDAQIKAQVQGTAGNTYDIVFVSEGNGRYIAEFKPILDGNYKVDISAQRKEIPLGKGSTEFIVQSIALEMQDTQLNERLLKEIALVSGGDYYHINDIDQLNIKEVNDVIVSTVENTIWDNIYVFISAIIFLSAEWFLRKRNGLV